MPTIGQQHKDSLGQTLTTIDTSIATMERLIAKIKLEKYRVSIDAPAVAALKLKVAALRLEHKNLVVGRTDQTVYDVLRPKIATAATDTAKLLTKVKADDAKSEPNAWRVMVTMTNGHQPNFSAYDSTFLNSLKSIVLTGGASDHGSVTLTNGTRCLHWAVGDVRIFGTVNATTGVFTFIGDGRHTGSTNTKYKVDLAAGGSTDASTK